jgi:3-oxoacyl-[acyl-carrier-protein] synthase II
VTALGDDLDSTWNRLLSGKTAIREVRRFATDAYNSGIAACIEGLADVSNRSMVYELLDRLFATMGPVPQDSFLITASTKAGIDSLEKIRRGIHADIRDCLLSHVADYISHRFALTKEGLNISAACASSTIALTKGASLIESGRAEAVLVCCFDLVTEFVFSGFCALQAMSTVPCMPFDRNRRGMNIGEGAAALLLMSPERALKEKKSAMGTLLGWSISNDALHITAPDREGNGLTQATAKALNKAGLKSDDISVFCAHGTGTIYNDAMELASYRKIFGEKNIPVFSVKGAMGHTMGPAGGIEAALCLKSLSTGIVPPTTGLHDADEGAKGLVNAEPVALNGDYILSTNSGFGGVNAAVILGKEDAL